MIKQDAAKLVHYFKTYHVLHAVRLIYILTAGPLLMRLVPCVTDLYLKLTIKRETLFAGLSLRRWAGKKQQLIRRRDIASCPPIGQIGLCSETIDTQGCRAGRFGEIPIADIDQDGFYRSRVGTLQGLPQVPEEEFVPRKRFHLKLVTLESRLCIRKDFGKDKVSFLRECLILDRMKSSGCNVPSILNISFSRLTLLLSYIPGHVLRERLAMEGAILRDRDVAAHPDFKHCSRKERWEKRIEQGHAVLPKVVDEQFADALFSQVRKAHQAGVFLDDIKFGNIIIEKTSNDPYLIDFDKSILVRGIGKICFSRLRDRDIESVNQLFQTEYLTHRKILEKINDFSQSVYAPSYIGFGMRLGGIGSETVGYGRWHYILKKHLPPYKGKRILDIGSNNGCNALQLLRNGAARVVGIELDPKAIAQGSFLRQAFEWADNRAYDFTYVQSDMKEVPRLALGRFDMAMAMCSLYYLSEEDMALVARHVATLTDTFVLQANTEKDISRQDPETYKKASLEYAVKVLKTAGFLKTDIIAPPAYSRPMVIGRK